MGFSGGSVGKESACNEGDAGAVGSSPGRDNLMEKSMAGNLLQYTCLENPWTQEASRLQSMGSQESHTNSVGHKHPARRAEVEVGSSTTQPGKCFISLLAY